MKTHGLLTIATLALLGCPPPGPFSAFTGVWATDGEPGVREGVVVFVQPNPDGDVRWSPLRLDLVDGGLVLEHTCRDFTVHGVGQVTAASGLRSAGPVTEGPDGFTLAWTLGEATRQLSRAALDARPMAADQFVLSASVTSSGVMTLHTEWRLDASVVLIETRDLHLAKRSTCR